MVDLSDEITMELDEASRKIDLALKLVDFKILDITGKRLNVIISKYADEITKAPDLRDKALAVYRKLDNAKRELVKIRRQQKREETNNHIQ